MVDVNFEEPTSPEEQAPLQENPKMVDSMMKAGLAKTPKEATRYLLVFVIALAVIALIIFAVAKGLF